MRPSNVSPRRVRTGTILALAVAASLMLAGCGGTTTSSASGPTPSATETVSREAGWIHNRIRACVQNKTTRNVDYVFGEDTVDDQVEYLSQTRGTMGPNAYVCGGSKSGGLKDDTVTFSFTNSAGKFVDLEFGNSWAAAHLTIFHDRTYDFYILTPGKTFTTVFSGQVIEALVNENLRKIDKLTAYPYDVKIYDAP
jgi:hypothetical protein